MYVLRDDTINREDPLVCICDREGAIDTTIHQIPRSIRSVGLVGWYVQESIAMSSAITEEILYTIHTLPLSCILKWEPLRDTDTTEGMLCMWRSLSPHEMASHGICARGCWPTEHLRDRGHEMIYYMILHPFMSKGLSLRDVCIYNTKGCYHEHREIP